MLRDGVYVEFTISSDQERSFGAAFVENDLGCFNLVTAVGGAPREEG